jgi:hypothetical protein
MPDGRYVRRLRIFGQRDKLKADRSPGPRLADPTRGAKHQHTFAGLDPGALAPDISFEVRVPLCLPPCQAKGSSAL